MKNSAELFVGYTTVPSLEIGKEISKHLIVERLAACTQLSSAPVISTYIWKNELNEDEEFVLGIKFTKSKAKEVEAAVIKMHPYECPQWTVFEADGVSESYAKWAAGI